MALSPVVGLDIGTNQMKAVELHPSGKEGLTITNLAFAPTPPGIIQNGIITDPRLMGHSIKQMFKDAGIRVKKVVASLAGQSSVVVRIIEVPKMSPQELGETMKWEVERHVPFSPTDVQLDYVALPSYDPNDENPNMAVLLAVAQNEMVNNFVDTLFAAGLDPVALDIEPLATGRALLDLLDGRPVVRQFPPPVIEDEEGNLISQDETIAVVNIGAANTDISIFENDLLIFPRSLSLAGDSITRQISESLGYTNEQAETLKREHGGVILERVDNFAEGYNQEEQQPGAEAETSEFENFRPAGLPQSGPLSEMSSPFDVDDETEEITAATPTEPDPDLERTQPIPRRTIDLARRAPTPEPSDLLSSIGGDENQREQVFDAISPVLMELSSELRRSLDYYRSRSQGSNVDRILLCGGTASLRDLDEYLSRELQVPVEVANPFAHIHVSSKHYDADYLTSIGPLFCVAVGLAVREAVFLANPQAAPKPAKAAKPEGASKFKLPFSLGLPKKEKTGATTGEPTLPPGQ
ncbi:MAG: type IV pilus assembly protein PilM [Capsulimonadaceae bacterium]|nr:type IV pilus assembly protein PilM [Capsulimonadaceae bacterium]